MDSQRTQVPFFKQQQSKNCAKFNLLKQSDDRSLPIYRRGHVWCQLGQSDQDFCDYIFFQNLPFDLSKKQSLWIIHGVSDIKVCWLGFTFKKDRYLSAMKLIWRANLNIHLLKIKKRPPPKTAWHEACVHLWQDRFPPSLFFQSTHQLLPSFSRLLKAASDSWPENLFTSVTRLVLQVIIYTVSSQRTLWIITIALLRWSSKSLHS